MLIAAVPDRCILFSLSNIDLAVKYQVYFLLKSVCKDIVCVEKFLEVFIADFFKFMVIANLGIQEIRIKGADLQWQQILSKIYNQAFIVKLNLLLSQCHKILLKFKGLPNVNIRQNKKI